MLASADVNSLPLAGGPALIEDPGPDPIPTAIQRLQQLSETPWDNLSVSTTAGRLFEVADMSANFKEHMTHLASIIEKVKSIVKDVGNDDEPLARGHISTIVKRLRIASMQAFGELKANQTILNNFWYQHRHFRGYDSLSSILPYDLTEYIFKFLETSDTRTALPMLSIGDQLRFLSTGRINLRDLGFKSFEEAKPFLKKYARSIPRLDLTIYSRSINGNDLKWLASEEFAHGQFVSFLNLRGCHRLFNEDLAHLESFENIVNLNVSSLFEVGDEGLTCLKGMPKLRVLNLSNNSSITGSFLLNISEEASIANLNLSGCSNFKDEGCEIIGNMSELIRLDLSRCRLLTDKGIAHLESLNTLRTLKLNCCSSLTVEAYKVIGGLRTLHHLSLASCHVSDEMVEQLQNLVFLQTLVIRFSKVTDEGMETIGTMNSLSDLDIGLSREFSLTGVRSLASLQHLQSLSFIWCTQLMGETTLKSWLRKNIPSLKKIRG